MSRLGLGLKGLMHISGGNRLVESVFMRMYFALSMQHCNATTPLHARPIFCVLAVTLERSKVGK